MKNQFSMPRKKRLRYALICFLIFAGLFIFTGIRSRQSVPLDARILCMSVASKEVAKGYEDKKYNENIWEDFLSAPYTDLYFRQFAQTLTQEHPGISYEPVTVAQMKESPVDAADALLHVYNQLISYDRKKGKQDWEKLQKDTAAALQKSGSEENPYASLIQTYGIETEKNISVTEEEKTD